MFDIKRLLASACLVVLVLCPTKAQKSATAPQPTPPRDTFLDHHTGQLARNPEGLSVKLRLADGKQQFRIGEVIRLELSFSSSLPDTYSLNNASYDRSGRLEIDSFVLDHSDGVTDPLRDYFHDGSWHMMGGLYSMSTVNKTEQVVNYDLNEWIRFSRPGKYRLYVVSGRISKGKPYSRSEGAELSPLTNLVEFEIVPADQKWEQQTIALATSVLDSSAKDKERRAAARVLRFLGTEAALKEIIKRFRGQDRACDFEYDFSLIGTPQRSFTVKQMEAALDASEQPITSSFIRTLSLLSCQIEDREPLPAYPSNEGEREAWQQQYQEHRAACDNITQRYLERLAIAVKQKQRAALALSLQTLIEDNSAPDEVKRKDLATSLATVFLDLPLETQRGLLEGHWQKISDPALLPVLRELSKRPPDMHEIPASFPGVALQRLYELAPEEGRQLILEEIQRPKPRVGIEILGLLPDKELPAFEDLIVERAINSDGGYRDQETGVALVERYASRASLPRLRVAYEKQIGTLGCTVQEGLISYFLRYDEPFGLEMLRNALAARKKTRCFANALTTAARKKSSPEFEQLALESLDDKNEDVMFQGVQVLAKYGAGPEKDRVKSRIKQQLDEWREEKRDPDAAISSSNFVHLGNFAEGLLQTYARAQAWLVDEAELQELAEWCLNEQCRGQLKNSVAQSNSEIGYSNSMSEGITFSVAQYGALSLAELKQKLAQFPKRTVFTWSPQREGREKEADVFAELKEYLEGFGMKVTRPKRTEK